MKFSRSFAIGLLILPKVFFLALIAGLPPILMAAPVAIEGEYECDECHGLLTIKRLGSNEFQVWWGTGGGSCGGDLMLNRKVRYAGGVLRVPHTLGKKRCLASIEFTDKGASPTDTCFAPEDEQDSTCALLGSYTKRRE